jgi:predicted RecB family endonuclease
VTAGADDLCGVESLLANVVQRVVEETRQLAERLGLEVVLLVLLLALLGLVLEPVQPVVDGVLQVSQTLGGLLLDDVKTGREVGGSKSSHSQQKQTGENALKARGVRLLRLIDFTLSFSISESESD